MFLLALAFCVLFFIILTGMVFPRISAVKAAVISASLFFCLYTVVSSMFFLADNFRLLVVLGVCGMISAGTAAFLFLFRKKRPEFSFDVKDDILPLIVCIIAVPFVLLKNQYFGMGQDQGVYQTVAMNYYYGYTDRIQTIDECGILDEEDAEIYMMLVDLELGGYDSDFSEFAETDASPETIPAYFHGIPVFASMLTMWAKIAGLQNMQDIQTVFYISSVMLVMMTCSNMKMKKHAVLTAGLMTAFCSVVIWVAKSALTEPFQMLLFSLFLYFLTYSDNKKMQWLSVVPVTAFSFYHVCIFTLVPVFVLVFVLKYIFEKDRQFIICAFVSVAAYLAGFFIMREQQPVYTLRNYADVYNIVSALNTGNIHIAVTAGCVFAFAVLSLVMFLAEKKIRYSPETLLSAVNSRILCRAAVTAVLAVPVIWMTVKMINKGYDFDDVRNTSIAGFVLTTGAFITLFAYGAALVKTDIVTKSPDRIAVSALFVYCVLIYSAFLRPDIKYYYYYSRYLAPFIPALAVFTAAAADRFRWYIPVPLTAASLACLVPFDTMLMDNMDDTRVEWSLLEDYDQTIVNGSCVIIDNDMLQTAFFPVRNMNSSAVFPLYRDIDEEVEFLISHYARVYYITDDTETECEKEYETVYCNVLFREEDDLNYTGDIFPMSYDFLRDSKTVRILEFSKTEE